MSVRDLIIVGAGPSGLSAAIAAKQRGLDYQVLEQGVARQFDLPLSAADGVLHDAGAARDRRAAVRLAVRQADARRGADATTARSSTRSICRSRSTRRSPSTRAGACDGERRTVFAVETRSSRGVRRVRHARARHPRDRLLRPPECCSACPARICRTSTTTTASRIRYYRQRVVIVGGGNSAAESALELFRAGAHVTLVHRGAELKSTIKYWVRPDIENRIKEGSIAARFNTHACTRDPADVGAWSTGTPGGSRTRFRPTPCSC